MELEYSCKNKPTQSTPTAKATRKVVGSKGSHRTQVKAESAGSDCDGGHDDDGDSDVDVDLGVSDEEYEDEEEYSLVVSLWITPNNSASSNL